MAELDNALDIITKNGELFPTTGTMKFHLKSYGNMSVNERLVTGETALLRACHEGNLNLTIALLDLRASPMMKGRRSTQYENTNALENAIFFKYSRDFLLEMLAADKRDGFRWSKSSIVNATNKAIAHNLSTDIIEALVTHKLEYHTHDQITEYISRDSTSERTRDMLSSILFLWG